LLLTHEDDLLGSFIPCSPLISSHLTQRVFANQSCLPQLIDFIKLFYYRFSFTFYTDSLVINIGSPTIKTEYAWYKTTTVVSSTFQVTVAVDWISSTKAELMAVLTAVVTLPPDYNVHIYMDSKALIDKFHSIQSSSSSYFDHTRPNLKDTYISLWFILFTYI